MPLDAVCLSAVVRELADGIVGARVEKVLQPERDEIALILRTNAGHPRLLLRANPNSARIHLSGRPKDNPGSPPMFCMLLRKHLCGARIRNIAQPPLERAVDIVFDTYDEMGIESEKILTAELMGKHSNLILRGPDGRIIDCIKRVDAEMSAKRQVLPGLFYRLPPAQDKRSFLETDGESFLRLLMDAPEEKTAEKWLLESFFGLSPLICRELAHRASGDAGVRLFELGPEGKKRLADAFSALRKDVKENNFTPYMLLDGGKPFDFSYLKITQYGNRMELERKSNFSGLLDDFYGSRDESEHRARRSQELVRLMTNTRDRTARRIAAQQAEFEAAQGRDRLRETGDILSANLYALEKGMERARLPNFFDPEGKEVEIELDARRTPQQNAAMYYKRYSRAKNAAEKLMQQLRQGREELAYLESVLEELSRCDSDKDLAEIRQELSGSGYLARKGPAAKEKGKALNPMTFVSSAGMRIYAGRNNRQNDLLTMKFASKRDLWLHTQKLHGCHVIVDCSQSEPDDETITEAAMVAAYFSQGKNSGNVPVDYTQVRNVKKPPGAKPGMVVYDHYKTAFVTPDEAFIRSAREKS